MTLKYNQPNLDSEEFYKSNDLDPWINAICGSLDFDLKKPTIKRDLDTIRENWTWTGYSTRLRITISCWVW